MSSLLASNQIQQIIQEIDSISLKNPVRIEGIPDAFKAFLISCLFQELNRSVLILTPTSEEAEKLINNLQFFFTLSGLSEEVYYFPSLEIIPYEQVEPPPGIVSERTRALRHLSQLPPESKAVVVTSVQALISHIPATDEFKKGALALRQFDQCPKDHLLEQLEGIGFEPVGMVESPGEFSHRGGILDFWPVDQDLPFRLEFEGDLIESLRSFNPFDQKSVASHESVEVWPVLNKKRGGHKKELSSLFSYFKDKSLLIVDEPHQMEKELFAFEAQVFEYYTQALEHRTAVKAPQNLYHSARGLLQEAGQWSSLYLSALRFETAGAKPKTHKFHFEIQSPAQLGLGLPGLSFQKMTELLEGIRKNVTVFLVCRSENQISRLINICTEHQIPVSRFSPPLKTAGIPDVPVFLATGSLTSGFLFKNLSIAFLTEEDLFGKSHRVKTPIRRKSKSFFSSLEDLKANDLAVHANHGIGRYLGLKHLTIDGVTSDFLTIEYKDHDKIFVPLDSLDLISKYSGPDGHTPLLDKLGGSSWATRKQKVKKTLESMTREILDLYAAREVAKGYSYSEENEMSQEFAATFEYEETPDQLRAIDDVIRDMENEKPMDRLICGDVGYGKTEVAMRAAFKAVKDNKQVCILVPTTLLAQQHFQNFTKRFSPFPVKVEMISRFRSPKEQKNILKQTTEGTVDILIGTHRLLQKDVHFKDLGLLVIDEEQRFGVIHKEKIKQIKKSIDVLTLTATPIPRTLQMSLMNLRNMSVIETAPADRLAIRTVITRLDRRIIREAIKRELDRQGQVFFVHNRVAGIEKIGNFIAELLPDVQIGIAHGQMNEHQLEEVMSQFIKGEHLILLSTTIIESGLDIPRANTIIINRADQFGLSELYQLRGRVGRSGQQAYAFLLIDNPSVLTDQAQKRLKALQEFTELGAGFKIAARDLEIRGAGHFLGTQQSGEIASIGFELYIKMLENCVAELKGKEIEEEFNPSLHLGISAFIPEGFIPDSYQRLYFYKKLSSLQKEEDLKGLGEELRDRFGPLPEEVVFLFKLIEIRILARVIKVSRIDKNSKGIYFTLHPSHEVSVETIKKLTKNPQIRFIPEFSFQLLLRDADLHQALAETKKVLQILL
ncbi:MAG: transcription-repair coupling factor [Nitrospirae bacterium]|nr:transcription-repair coupling factor [Nitrospirota bacterium]MBI3352932.1 transcription-repair coupling factor [Nitrospirota bacterium]